MEAENRPKGRSLGPLKTLVPFMRPYKRQIGYALLSLLAAAGATLALPAALREVIDRGFSSADTTQIDKHFLTLFFVACALGLATAMRFFWVSWIGERVVADVRSRLYRHVLTMSPAFFETTRTGEVLSRLNTDTTLIQTVVGSSLSIALRSTLLAIGTSVMLAVTSPKLAGLIGLLVPLVLVPVIIFGRYVRTLSRQSQDRVADFSAVADETLNAVQTVQSFSAEKAEADRFAGSVEDAFRAARKRVSARAIMTLLVILFFFGGITLVLWSGARDVLAGEMSSGALGQFVLYAVIGAGSVGALSEVWSDVQRAAGAMERITELLLSESAVPNPSDPLPLPSNVTGEVRFNNVAFAYPAHPDKAVLSDFNLTIAPGENVALVGPSGAGKTTILQLLLRFYDPTSGSITLDGNAINLFELAELRHAFGLVAQAPVIFAASVRDNIRYGRPDATDEEVMLAAKAAQVHEFAERLPDGYETFLGEKGVRLSGGQRQRLAIARAILRDPPVLLLDEATSSLDARGERLVQQALEALMKNRTTVVIAHRLATVQRADRIVVLDQGRQVAEGTHTELVRQDGLYAELAALQFAVTQPEAVATAAT